ncbi:MAG: radical SAM protein [archaeon]
MISTINCKLKDNLYFNVNKNSGRWSFSKEPKSISENRTISELNEWDNDIKTLVIDVTDDCNLNCVYCSRQCARNNSKNIDKELLKKVLKKAADYSSKKNILMTIQFHGGEPLIMFEKIILAVDNLTKKERSFLKLRIQSNGILINEEIIKKCQERNIEMGISLDGRDIENDITRKDNHGEGTFKEVMKSLDLLRKYQKEISCLTVVTNINIDNLDNILNFFNKIGLTNIGFLPLYEEPNTRTIKKEIVPDMKRLAENQKKLFDRWIDLLIKKENKDLNITTFQILIWNLLAANGNNKKFRINCGVGINSLFVESDGSVWGCGAFSYADELKLGNLDTQNLFQIQENSSYEKFKCRITTNTKKCCDCVYQFICKGGCVANGFRQEQNIFDTDIWCEYWSEIIKHILLKVNENTDLIKLIPNYNIKK